MAVTFTIGGVSFGALSVSAGRQALDCKYGSEAQKVVRYSPFGTKGNLLTRGEGKGRKVAALLRYVEGGESTVEAMINADMTAWKKTAVDIVYAGITFKRCTLDENGMNKIAELKSAGGLGAWTDVVAVFTSDAGEDE
jgi:hypothetical protein